MLQQLADRVASALPFAAFGYGTLAAHYVLVAGVASLFFYGVFFGIAFPIPVHLGVLALSMSFRVTKREPQTSVPATA